MKHTNGTTDTNPLGKATSIDFFNFSTPQMRAFHLSWIAFFLCFFAWFGISPLMAVVRDELSLTEAQIGNIGIAAVATTALARPVLGSLCDWIGPRKAYSGLLIFASFPVMGIGLATSYEAFLICRLLIGFIGASFVITQYHTSKMFASNAVGTANAITAGWGNLGGGATQAVMPLIFGMFLAMGLGDFWSWRLSMVVAGVVCFLTGIAYYALTQDTPAGNYDELRAQGDETLTQQSASGSFLAAIKDYRVWILTVLYGVSFVIELTMNNFLALYFTDYFSQSLTVAGTLAGSFGLMNLFARPMGGWISDTFAVNYGLRGRVLWLCGAMFVEGLLMMAFAQMDTLLTAAALLIPFSIMVMAAEGAMYSVVPFVNRKALGSVAGLVGAGGTGGAVAAGFLFKGAFDWDFAFFLLGGIVTVMSLLALAVTFSDEYEAEIDTSIENAQKQEAEKRARETEREVEREAAPAGA
jgi:NNP family nitrate/nitrite transporter-like MFS transporter